MSYSPNYASEKLLPGPPYMGCRVSADWAATDIATHGESSRRDDGRLKLKRARTQDLRKGWRAFATQTPADSNGWPDAGDVRRIHAGWTDLPMPLFVETHDFQDVWEAIGEYAVSIALRLRAVPANSPLRKYTSADHQMVAYRKRNGNEARVMDPMHPHSLTYQGVWVPRAHLATGARAIEDGLIVAELYPAGEWTREALMRKRKNARIARIEDAAAATEASLRARIAALEAAGPPTDDQLANAHAGGRESAFVQVLQGVQAMRSEPEDR